MLLLLLFALPLFAAGPDNVLLVVNTNSPLSLRIGEFYTNWHHLKPEQVCRISTATTEAVSRSVYDNEIATRIGACLSRSRRIEQTHYLVLTKGLPLRVSPQLQGDWKLTDGAAVDSELTLLYAKLKGITPNLSGSLSNPFFGRVNEPFAHPAFPMYLVTRLAAYTYEDTIRSIQRCRGARNTGKVVLDLKDDTDAPGNDWLRTASILLPAARVQIDTSPKVLPSATAVIGYASWGSNDKNRALRKSGMQWLPGAIATEYVSSSLRTLEAPPASWQIGNWNDKKTYYAGTPQSMILDYIAEGASGVSGAVDEPYLAFTTRPNLLFPAYLSGRNLAESFFLAMPALSWQFIVIGDPLCSLQ
jgi:uncharacterized protein (TIGR03790 family)